MNNQKKPPESLRNYLDIYFNNLKYNTNNKNDEFEIKFGNNPKNRLTKIQFDNTIQKLYSLGFKMMNDEGDYHLNIVNEYIDFKTQKNKQSNIRTEIKGLDNISTYCKTNTFDTENVPSFISFIQKKRKIADNNILKPIDNRDYEFRVNYKVEHTLFNNTQNEDVGHKHIKNMLTSWKHSKKIYRFIKRFTMVHNELPVKVDMSILKTSSTRQNYRTNQKYFVPTLKIEESNVFNNVENYEIEIELDNDKVIKEIELQTSSNKDKISHIEKKLKRTIKYVLSGIQNSNFPISYTKQNEILYEYYNQINFITHTKEDNNVKKYKVQSRDFIGPQSTSLEMKHIIPLKDDINSPNINMSYSVTEKADGIRKLLYINKNGELYFINQQMEVEYTGVKSDNKELVNTIIDGEHVLYDKNNNYINRFLCFDIYIHGGVDCRMYPLFKYDTDDTDDKKLSKDYRMRYLENTIRRLKLKSIVNSNNMLKVTTKRFLTNKQKSIFKCCEEILTQVDEGLFEYETDGLIFTPMYKSVGSDTLGTSYDFKNKKYVKWDYKLENKKKTWVYSFKWKPPEFNTIDFLVKTQKKNGKETIQNIHDGGKNVTSITNIKQYKTLILNVGFNEKFHGFINPYIELIQYNIHKKLDNRNYRPMPFYPSSYQTDYPTYLTNIELKVDGNNKYLATENNKELFLDDTIVEFRFDPTKPKQWQWIPIRVRNDKTTEYKNGKKNYGNSYNVADSVWRSINNPITKDIICGKEKPNSIDEDMYYNRSSNKTNTSALRDFHNKYVKKKLINSVSNPGDTLIDLTVGKAGDLFKWTEAKLSFVFGMDLYKDNIENRIDGACARWLNTKNQINNTPDALFITGDAGKNFINGDCCQSEKNKEIINAVFGKGPRDEEFLGTAVYNQYGKAENGFDVVSNQFSIHYLFENKYKFLMFMKNITDVCKLGGHFIGTCFDGEKIFRDLRNKKLNEGIIVQKNDKKIWEVIKKYENDEFPNDINSLGYKIEVYQESINKTFGEYLVNFNYLTRVMESFGFTKVKTQKIKKLGLSSSINSFEKVYKIMEDEIKNKKINPNKLGNANIMSPEEKRISFYNNYFIYKKIRNVDSDEVMNALLNNMSIDDDAEVDAKLINKYEEIVDTINNEKEEDVKLTKEDEKTQPKKHKPKKKKIKKIKTKLTLDNKQ